MRWNPVAPLLALARERAAAWMRRRQGVDLLPVALERRRLYILPTGTGVGFAVLLFLMLIAGLNYGNSLALFLTFSLSAFALVAMQQCHRNLLGVAVIAAAAPAVFARTTGAVHLTLANPASLPRARVEAAVAEMAAVAVDLPARSRGGSDADEWLGLRPFRDGDSPRQVDWKAYAREAPLLIKEYSPAGSELRLFDFAQLTHLDTEARLSQLARWVVEAEAHGERYGVALPGVLLPADRGPEHRHRCLAALAVFGIDDGLKHGGGAPGR